MISVMERNVPRPGEFYRHFKNKLYQIISIAKHSETDEELVIYQALYGDFTFYARPLELFLSRVDYVKYPDSKQQYRFEMVQPKEILPVSSQEPIPKSNNSLMEFLDARTYEKKRDIFRGMRNHLNEKLMHDIAASLDLVIEETDLDAQYNGLMNCLDTMVRFECNRLR